MIPMRLSWQRCPDGVEVVNGRYRSRTKRRVTVDYEVTSLEDTTAIRFLNTGGEEERIAGFLSRFGHLDQREEIDTSEVDERYYGALLGVVVRGTTTPADTASQINHCLADAGASLIPSVDLTSNGLPRVTLQPSNLISLMAMELAFAGSAGAEAAACEHCETLYLTGPLTGRRSHSKYCSDRCRVAAMRKRNSGEESSGTR